ncbi:hypothetical protein [Vibrio phage LP.1]|nr:hypothetical protein [Vibrio phage LP.1]
MATINTYDLATSEPIVETTLTASDDAVVSLNKANIALIVTNDTGGDLTLNIVGAGVSNAYRCPGVGSIDLTAGAQATATDAAVTKINLSPEITKYLGDGTLTITGGTGATAYIIQS